MKCSTLQSGIVNTVIDQGTDQTFVLEVNVTNPKVSAALTSTLQVSLQNFSSMTMSPLGPGATQSHFQWVDKDAFSSTPYLWVEYPDTVVKSTSYQG